MSCHGLASEEPTCLAVLMLSHGGLKQEQEVVGLSFRWGAAAAASYCVQLTNYNARCKFRSLYGADSGVERVVPRTAKHQRKVRIPSKCGATELCGPLLAKERQRRLR